MDELSDEQWSALKEQARSIGKEHGSGAAEWVELDAHSAQRVISGLDEDIDPEVADAYIPRDGMSGEFAGDYGTRDLYGELGLERDGSQDSDDMELVTAFQDGFAGAAAARLIERAKEFLE